MTAFLIVSALALLFVGIGLRTRHARKPVPFFTTGETGPIRDVPAYNHALSRLWLTFALGVELLGLPLLAVKQNSPWALLLVPAAAGLLIGILITYNRILNRYSG